MNFLMKFIFENKSATSICLVMDGHNSVLFSLSKKSNNSQPYYPENKTSHKVMLNTL